VNKLYRLFPSGIRYWLKSLLNINNHRSSIFDNLKAQRDATGKKRLDNAMLAFTEKLSRANIDTLEGKKCLEIGTGFVPTDALCMHLLGASAVFTTDYNAIAKFRLIKTAISSSNIEVLMDTSSRFARKDDVWQRYSTLINHLESNEYLEEIGIRYIAPFDLATLVFPEGSFDFIYSTDVLEHIHVSEILKIVCNLNSMLVPNGKMVHFINLRDHKNLEADPFEFLSSNTKYNVSIDQDGRGNRMRRTQWFELFKSIPDLYTTIPWIEGVCSEVDKPRRLLPEFENLSKDDCFCANIIISSIKNQVIQS